MSIIATMLAAFGGSGAAAGAAGTAATTAGSAAAGSSFLGTVMDKGAAALSAVGDYAGAATDAVGLTDFAGDEQLEQLNKQLQMLQDEAQAIKLGEEYTSEEDRDTDLASNAARTQETQNEINKLTEAKAKASSSGGLSGTLSGSKGGSTAAPSIASGSVSSGQFDSDALGKAAVSGLNGMLGGAPKTTQQQLIMAQNNAFGGFKV